MISNQILDTVYLYSILVKPISVRRQEQDTCLRSALIPREGVSEQPKKQGRSSGRDFFLVEHRAAGQSFGFAGLFYSS